jgi:hypothetical protein
MREKDTVPMHRTLDWQQQEINAKDKTDSAHCLWYFAEIDCVNLMQLRFCSVPEPNHPNDLPCLDAFYSVNR